MVYVPDDQNSLSLLSELSIYNPRLPFSMKCSGADFCQDNGEILMIVGEISKKQSKKPLEIVFKRAGTEVNNHSGSGKEPNFFLSYQSSFSDNSLSSFFKYFYQDESFHVLIDLKLDMIQRWGTYDGLREGAGEPGEGTTIDTDEPFMLKWVHATFYC